MILLLSPYNRVVCDLGSFSKLACELGFFRGLKRCRKVWKGLGWLVLANSVFNSSSSGSREKLVRGRLFS